MIRQRHDRLVSKYFALEKLFVVQSNDAPAADFCPALICFSHTGSFVINAAESGGGPPHSKTLARRQDASLRARRRGKPERVR